MKTKELKPIKRHNTLVQLSREHHYGLLLVWKIRLGLRNKIDPSRISDYILYFFEQELRTHFREEEDIFFLKLPHDDLLAEQAYKDHHTIYTLISEISKNKTDNKLLLSFASCLEAHIRFEERVLFNHIQNILSQVELEEISNQKSKLSCNADDTWKDKFWEKSNSTFQSGMLSISFSFVISLFILLFTACNSTPDHDNLPEVSKINMHEEVNSKGLTLNNGSKWKADSITNVNVAVIESIALKVKPATVDEFISVGNKIHEAINKLVQDCKMQGAEHEALHHWLEPILELNNKLMESKTIEESKDIFNKEKEQINIYSDYFEQ